MKWVDLSLSSPKAWVFTTLLNNSRMENLKNLIPEDRCCSVLSRRRTAFDIKFCNVSQFFVLLQKGIITYVSSHGLITNIMHRLGGLDFKS